MKTDLESMSEKLRALTSATQFAESVGTKFQMNWESGESAELELIAATKLGAKNPRSSIAREPFSLIFRAASPQFYLPQGTYLLEHERHGALAFFLVPIGADETGMRFEAIFN